MGRIARERILLAMALVLAAASLIYLIHSSVLNAHPEIDFRFIWLAGHMWALGRDPYAADYTSLGARLFPTGNAIAYWLYPPQWWAICRLLATASPARALVAWRGVNAVLVVVSGLLPVLGLRRAGARVPVWSVPLAIVYVVLIQATPQALSIGQTSILILFGLALVVAGVLGDVSALVAAGLVLVLMKPQIGVVVVAGLLTDRRWWLAIAIAAVASVCLGLPQFIPFGFRPTVGEFLHNLSEHGSIGANGPENLTGITHLLWLAGVPLPTTLATVLAVAGAMTLGVLARRHGHPAERKEALLVSTIACCCFFVPLHTYDVVIFAPLALLLPVTRRAARLLLGASALLSFRPGNVAHHLGAELPLPGGSTPHELLLISLSGLLAVLAAVAISSPRSVGRQQKT